MRYNSPHDRRPLQGLVHGLRWGVTYAHVLAESLYEAVALATAEFRNHHMVPKPGPTTEFTVASERPPVEHRIRLSQVMKWAEETTREGPAGVTKRRRVKALLG
jgi:hypothetical protein